MLFFLLAAVLTPHAFLQVYWHHAAGDLDRYVVLVSYNHTILQNQSIPTGHNECAFSSLTPGRQYTVTVETWSGSYVSSVSTHGRTRESEFEGSNSTDVGDGFLNDGLFLSPSSCEESVGQERRNSGAEHNLEPRFRRRGSL